MSKKNNCNENSKHEIINPKQITNTNVSNVYNFVIPNVSEES